MTQSRPPAQLAKAWERYRHNPIRHLTAIARHAEIETMTRLEKRGYRKLSMSYGGPIMLLRLRPQRLTDLANNLGISKQLCLQTLRQLEKTGLIERTDDPQDRRAKRLALSARGERLTADAFRELADVQREYAALIGDDTIAHLERTVARCVMHLRVPGSEALQNLENTGASLTSMLGALTRELHQRLMTLNADYGHRDLQMSFAQVLTNVDLHGTSVSAIAAQNGVTPQAISRIAKELEELGYVKRRSSDSDGRARILYFTPHGLELLIDSVGAMDTIEAELAMALGQSDWRRMTAGIRALYEGLGAESGLVGGYDAAAVKRIYEDGTRQPRHRPTLAELLLYLASLDDTAADAIVTDERGHLRLSPQLIERLGSVSIAPDELEKTLRQRVDHGLLKQLREQLVATR